MDTTNDGPDARHGPEESDKILPQPDTLQGEVPKDEALEIDVPEGCVPDSEVVEISLPENAAPIERVLFCPICARQMAEDSYDEVKIDFCHEHGVWLDRGELESITRRVQAKGWRAYRKHYKALRKLLERHYSGGWGPFVF